MDTRARGDIAEAAILHAMTAMGVPVAIPFGRFGPYDLVAEIEDGRFLRIQVKSGRLRPNGTVEFNCCGTDHGSGAGSYDGCADVFAVHVHETGGQYVVPVAEARAAKMYLRIAEPANNQRRGVRFAADYRLVDWVERYATMRSSSPATATTSPATS